MKCPDSIRLAAIDVTIRALKVEERGLAWGRFVPSELAIELDFSAPYAQQLDIFLHEVTHAIWAAYGLVDEDEEERCVSIIATGWAQIYRDNPSVLKWIQYLVRKANG